MTLSLLGDLIDPLLSPNDDDSAVDLPDDSGANEEANDSSILVMQQTLENEALSEAFTHHMKQPNRQQRADWIVAANNTKQHDPKRSHSTNNGLLDDIPHHAEQPQQQQHEHLERHCQCVLQAIAAIFLTGLAVGLAIVSYVSAMTAQVFVFCVVSGLLLSPILTAIYILARRRRRERDFIENEDLRDRRARGSTAMDPTTMRTTTRTRTAATIP
ncbi:hypothetical protein ACA910_020993 [Epithemia clementina (nom. ined.)]